MDSNLLARIPCPVCQSTKTHFETNRFDKRSLSRCLTCRHVFLDPPLSAEALNNIYTTYHHNENEDSLFKMLHNWFNEPDSPYQNALRFIENNGGFKDKRIIDIGCGPGLFLNECKKRGAEVIGVDLAPLSAKLAKERFGIHVYQSELLDVLESKQVREHGFDWVTAFEVIEHVSFPKVFIGELHRLISPKGKIVLSTPNFHLYELLGKAAPVINQWEEHLQYFEVDSLKACFKDYPTRISTITSVQRVNATEQNRLKVVHNKLLYTLWTFIKHIPFLSTFLRTLASKAPLKHAPQDSQQPQPTLDGIHLLCLAESHASS